MFIAGTATALNVTGFSMPIADTSMVFVPMRRPNVNKLSALPFSSVVISVILSVPSPATTANVIETPSSAEPFSSLTSTTNGFDKTAPATPL